MPTLYRVFPFLITANEDEPGGGRYVPAQGGGRLDNPSIYSVLYLSDAAAGAIAEAFGRFPEWTAALLRGSPSLPGSTRALARYKLADEEAVCNLDDARLLLELGLRPSEVVTRDYVHSRGWSMRIYDQRRWSGIRWWSYYDPRWASFGLWNIGRLSLEEISVLRLDNPALLEASRTIVRPVLNARRQ